MTTKQAKPARDQWTICRGSDGVTVVSVRCPERPERPHPYRFRILPAQRTNGDTASAPVFDVRDLPGYTRGSARTRANKMLISGYLEAGALSADGSNGRRPVIDPARVQALLEVAGDEEALGLGQIVAAYEALQAGDARAALGQIERWLKETAEYMEQDVIGTVAADAPSSCTRPELYVLVHEHQFGVDVFPLRSASMLDVDQAIAAVGANYDAKQREEAEIRGPWSLDVMPLLRPSARRSAE